MRVCSFFFFSSRRRHTRYWRDWSSDVCSSDLFNGQPLTADHGAPLRLLVPVKLGLKNVKGHYQDYVCRGRAKRLLGRTWVFPLRRNLTPLQTQLATGLASIYFYYILNWS